LAAGYYYFRPGIQRPQARRRPPRKATRCPGPTRRAWCVCSHLANPPDRANLPRHRHAPRQNCLHAQRRPRRVADKASLRPLFDDLLRGSTIVTCPGNIQSPGPWRRNATPQQVSGTLVCS